MIRRIEFYAAIALVLAFMAAGFYITHKPAAAPVISNQIAVLQTQRDSMLASALAKDLKADSLQAVINRRNLDIQQIQKKYDALKKNVLVLGADSTLAFLLRATSH